MVDLYPQIFKRKSIRDYYLEPLEEVVLQNVLEQVNNLEPLYDDIKVDLKIVSSDDVNPRMMKKKHPITLLYFQKIKRDTRPTLASCSSRWIFSSQLMGWAAAGRGSPNQKKRVVESSDIKFIILMAFGKPKVQLHRTSNLEFNRKPLPKISDIKNEGYIGALLEAARLAPSATNSQPWFFLRVIIMLFTLILSNRTF